MLSKALHVYLPLAEAHRCLSLLGGRWLLPWSVTYLFLIKSERKNKLLQCKLVDEISPPRNTVATRQEIIH